MREAFELRTGVPMSRAPGPRPQTDAMHRASPRRSGASGAWRARGGHLPAPRRQFLPVRGIGLQAPVCRPPRCWSDGPGWAADQHPCRGATLHNTSYRNMGECPHRCGITATPPGASMERRRAYPPHRPLRLPCGTLSRLASTGLSAAWPIGSRGRPCATVGRGPSPGLSTGASRRPPAHSAGAAAVDVAWGSGYALDES